MRVLVDGAWGFASSSLLNTAEADRAEAEAWLLRQDRWEQRLAELRRPRPVGRPRVIVRRPAAAGHFAGAASMRA